MKERRKVDRLPRLRELPEGFKDAVYNVTEIHFDWRDRVRILFGRRVKVVAITATEHLPGKTQGRAEVTVDVIFPRLPR